MASPKTTAGVSKSPKVMSPKTPKGPKTFVKSPPQAPQKPKRRGMLLQSPPKVFKGRKVQKMIDKTKPLKARKSKSKEGKKPMKVATIDRWVRHLDKTVKEETCVVVHTFKEDKVALASCLIDMPPVFSPSTCFGFDFLKSFHPGLHSFSGFVSRVITGCHSVVNSVVP